MKKVKCIVKMEIYLLASLVIQAAANLMAQIRVDRTNPKKILESLHLEGEYSFRSPMEEMLEKYFRTIESEALFVYIACDSVKTVLTKKQRKIVCDALWLIGDELSTGFLNGKFVSDKRDWMEKMYHIQGVST